MDILNGTQHHQALRVRFDQDVCFLQIHRPHANNTICDRLVQELGAVLEQCAHMAKIVVLEGSPEVFCFGADFEELQRSPAASAEQRRRGAEDLYDLWLRLAGGPYITIAHVRGKANAGGVGFVAACDIALAQEQAVFSLSEMLFGLMPACVLPFLIRRTGAARANYMTLTTQPVSARQALEWGVIDACEENSENLLRKHLLRLRRLTRPAIVRYKQYMRSLDGLSSARPAATRANAEVFSDPENLQQIARYIRTGQFPWEAPR